LGDGQKIVWGLGYRYIDADLGSTRRDNGFTVSFTDRHLHLWSAFVQDQIELVKDKLSLILGSKFEHNDFTGFEAEPSARLLWTPTERQTVWAAVSRAVRTPTVSEDEATARLLPLQTNPPPTCFRSTSRYSTTFTTT
jgi:iron complex outermembrane receptor protein